MLEWTSLPEYAVAIVDIIAIARVSAAVDGLDVPIKPESNPVAAVLLLLLAGIASISRYLSSLDLVLSA